jgi:hypothetical protein
VREGGACRRPCAARPPPAACYHGRGRERTRTPDGGVGTIPRGDGDTGEREVSWRLIARGMVVIGRDGEVLGRVTRVLGDPGRDIFDGVALRQALFAPERAARLDRIERITERAVHLRLARAEAETLPPPVEPARLWPLGGQRRWRQAMQDKEDF